LLCGAFALTLAVFLASRWAEVAPAREEVDPPSGDGDAGANLFNEQVGPLLTGKCLSCHGNEPRKGGLDLTRRASALAGGEGGPAVVPGQPDESLLFEKVAAGEMPPRSPLKPEQVAAVKRWIEVGAPYPIEPLRPGRAGPDWWSLRPIGRPQSPAVDGSWARSPLDAFVLAKLREHGLAPSLEAARISLIRRVTFDLTGLPPTLEEVAEFVADSAPDAYERLVDRLLESPHYGQRWGRHWLDVVRFGESHGYETNRLRPDAWPYRDYVIRAFNRDTPLDRFVLEQLAGDTIVGADWLTRSATGFLVAGTHDLVKTFMFEARLRQRADDLDDLITATGTALLGLTVNCARCHDHKFDPITQRDYYGLQAVFAGVFHGSSEIPAEVTPEKTQRAATIARELDQVIRKLDDLEPLARPDVHEPRRSMIRQGRNIERFAPVNARFIRFNITATFDNNEAGFDELEVWTEGAGDASTNAAASTTGARASASSQYPDSSLYKVAHLNDGRYGDEWSWVAAERGPCWVEIELAAPVRIDRIVWSRDRVGTGRDRIPSEYTIEVALAPGQWQVVASSSDRLPFSDPKAPAQPRPKAQWPALPPPSTERAALVKRQAELRAQLDALGLTRKVYAGIFLAPEPTCLLVRGDPTKPGETVLPSAPAAINPPLVLAADLPDPERRRALAAWLGDRANPLPARVMVNRLWHYHFGQGIVATPSDFGFNGAPPSHPELLDWLARQYLDNGLRLKPLHRLIVTSSTYRQSSHPSAAGLARDSQNRWLWRMTPRRLEAEAIRDAILAASGHLNLRMGGPGFYFWEKSETFIVTFEPKKDLGPEEFRRMVYQYRPKTQHDPTFGAFDCPDGALVTPRRSVSTTALQALNLLNSDFIVDQSAALAARLVREAGTQPADQAGRGFQVAFGRAPTGQELAASAALINEHGLAMFCRALFNANEFVYVP
jgi:mono/diheme cytochrome c family protein